MVPLYPPSSVPRRTWLDVSPPGSDSDASGLARAGITHLLLHSDLFGRWLQDNFTPEQVGRLQRFSDRPLTLILEHKGYALFAVSR